MDKYELTNRKKQVQTWTVCASVGSDNINTLSLVGMQLLEKYKENFDVSSKGPLSGFNSGGSGNYMSFYTKNIKASRTFTETGTLYILPKYHKMGWISIL